ncbi:hypothetical protein [Caulobacter sp. RL271]|uniref:DUF1640 domain-containing protein n=1 Tax=Caulobacter segnis TaxID=88688 RepID=A0ABY4ZPG8_9CAUL|nr:hypothetical protein [Caulobacter segnis]USQ94269.1 hypothetical protein MZV50_16890 [Caulobacter segnis]
MNTAGFDSLSASKRLREAGLEEHVAEAIVEIVRQTSSMPDIGHLATKDDLRQFATKDDLKQLEMGTKADFQEAKLTIAQLEVRLSEKIRLQGWSLLGGMALLLALNTAMAKLIG